MGDEFVHIPVMLSECLDGLAIKPCGIYVDGTAGGAGHSAEIAKRLSGGRLIAIDRDPDAVKIASERLAAYPAEVVRGNYSEIGDILSEREISAVDGILLDLGVSSHQLDETERGFSYHRDAPLDMRMSREGMSARDVVNSYPEAELTRILFEYGEEKNARRIASLIVKERLQKPIETTLELADIVKRAYPAAERRAKNPARQTFQAIRMEVNGELSHLSAALDSAFDSLCSGGRLVIITFHSLEDRLVKQRFAALCKGCICPPDFPQCVCGRKPRGRLVNRKPITAGEEELLLNSRSRSAKLRIIEKL